jgi:hypothetical protein
MASTAMGLFKKATSGNDAYERNLKTKTSPADVIMWSGSKDSQTSYVEPPFCSFWSMPLSSHEFAYLWCFLHLYHSAHFISSSLRLEEPSCKAYP